MADTGNNSLRLIENGAVSTVLKCVEGIGKITEVFESATESSSSPIRPSTLSGR